MVAETWDDWRTGFKRSVLLDLEQHDGSGQFEG
jgi:hypothetical protein